MKTFLNKLRLRSKKNKIAHKEATQQFVPLSESPPNPSIAMTPNCLKPCEPPSESPFKPLPLSRPPPTPSSIESSPAGSTSSAITTTTATTIDASEKDVLISPSSSSAGADTGLADSVSVQRTAESSNLHSESTSGHVTGPTSWSKLAGANLVARISTRERTRQEILLEIVFSEEK